jgi:hypothetical protein
MGGRWACRITGKHLWTKHESDEGRFMKCTRCQRIQWFSGDDTGVDFNTTPPITAPGNPGGSM